MAQKKARSSKKTSAGGGDSIEIQLGGRRLSLRRHETDFTIDAPHADVAEEPDIVELEHRAMAPRVTRVTAQDADVRDLSMDRVRDKRVAHHVYIVDDTLEEVTIDDHVLLRLHSPSQRDLDAIIDEFSLVEDGRMGSTYVLRVTNATGQNPIKTANAISQRPEVLSCTPQLIVERLKHQMATTELPVLFNDQWYLAAELNGHSDVHPRADINAPEAWEVTKGDPEIVIAIMDDGFDLEHPAFDGKKVHPAKKDFAGPPSNGDPSPGAEDFHGTPVASIATASETGGAMIGVAPGCTILPIRIGFGSFSQFQTLQEFRHASQHADVVNCSFGFPPLSFDIFDAGFREEMAAIAATGGRRGKGLVMVFSAGNDDAPTRLAAAENVNGVRFLGRDQFGNFVVKQIPQNTEVFSAYPSLENVVVVSAISSRGRKSGYSNWGEHITVGAPSSNGHELGSLAAFSANYRGLGQIAAVNRPGIGTQSRPLKDDPGTPTVREDFYTDDFGGTSGAAPVASGVVGLMLSVNNALKASEVKRILEATASHDLDAQADLTNDPNLQGLTGDFVNGRSLFFGSGKVDAFAAVTRARARAELATVKQKELSVTYTFPNVAMGKLELDGHVIAMSSGTYTPDVAAGDHRLEWWLVAPEGTEYTIEVTAPPEAKKAKHTGTIDHTKGTYGTYRFTVNP